MTAPTGGRLQRIFAEACVDSVHTAKAAERAGAGRVELCGPGVGGTTPSFGLMAHCRDVLRLPIHVMIRPREGDFVYSDDEMATMLRDITAARSARVDGVVFGVLRQDNTLDEQRMRELVEHARPLRVACHRAFDMTPHADEALGLLLQLGVDIVLTSGHRDTALAGQRVLAKHVQRAGSRLVIMAGGGVRARNVLEIVANTGVCAVHVRATDPAVFSEVMQTFGRRPT